MGGFPGLCPQDVATSLKGIRRNLSPSSTLMEPLPLTGGRTSCKPLAGMGLERLTGSPKFMSSGAPRWSRPAPSSGLGWPPTSSSLRPVNVLNFGRLIKEVAHLRSASSPNTFPRSPSSPCRFEQPQHLLAPRPPKLLMGSMLLNDGALKRLQFNTA